MREIDYTLYLVTDSGLNSAGTLADAVDQAIQGGVTIVQLREKDIDSVAFYETAFRIKGICDIHRVPLIINDRVDIALAVDAAGVHIGQGDLPVEVVRRLIGKEKILGVSVSTLAEAVAAEQKGASYLGVGAMFDTATKPDPTKVSIETLNSITLNTRIPVVAIGGINMDTLPALSGTGIAGICAVSAIISAENILKAAATLKTMFLDMRKI